MSFTPRNGRETDGNQDDDEQLVPEGVLRGIEDVAEGRTMSEEDLDAVLKF